MERWHNPREHPSAYTVSGAIRDGDWLGAHLRQRRHELELTQEQLADRAGTSTAEVTHLERGTRLPSLPTLQRVLAALGESLLVGTRAGGTPSSNGSMRN
jgi:transcriptional regulator with XRE-family HTH domain